MVSRYSIIQYVPNPIIDERINIGVIAFSDDIVRVQFLQNWDRVSAFAMGKNIQFLKEFAQRMEKATDTGLLFPGDEDNGKPKQERLMKIAQTWRCTALRLRSGTAKSKCLIVFNLLSH